MAPRKKASSEMPAMSDMTNSCSMDQLPKSGRNKDSINCLCLENTSSFELRVQRKKTKGGMAATVPISTEFKLQ